MNAKLGRGSQRNSPNQNRADVQKVTGNPLPGFILTWLSSSSRALIAECLNLIREPGIKHFGAPNLKKAGPTEDLTTQNISTTYQTFIVDF